MILLLLLCIIYINLVESIYIRIAPSNWVEQGLIEIVKSWASRLFLSRCPSKLIHPIISINLPQITLRKTYNSKKNRRHFRVTLTLYLRIRIGGLEGTRILLHTFYPYVYFHTITPGAQRFETSIALLSRPRVSVSPFSFVYRFLFIYCYYYNDYHNINFNFTYASCSRRASSSAFKAPAPSFASSSSLSSSSLSSVSSKRYIFIFS